MPVSTTCITNSTTTVSTVKVPLTTDELVSILLDMDTDADRRRALELYNRMNKTMPVVTTDGPYWQYDATPAPKGITWL